jgi:hypothetical protein
MRREQWGAPPVVNPKTGCRREQERVWGSLEAMVNTIRGCMVKEMGRRPPQKCNAPTSAELL